VTQTLAAEGGGRWQEYVGGYSDWLEQRPVEKAATEPSPGLRPPSPARAGEGRAPAAKLSYKEARELAQLPARIEALESEQRDLHARLASADYHRQGAAQIKADGLRVAAIETELATAFDRWAELEARTQTTKPG